MSDEDLPDLTMIELGAIEDWQYKGVRCIIRPGLGTLNGYARLPTSMRAWWTNENEAGDVLAAHCGITYGPDDDGFVGFDTGHAFDYWAADDLIGIVDDEGLKLANTFAEMNSKSPYARRWTRARLREETETLAEQIAALAGELDLMLDSLEDIKRQSNEGESE